MKVHVWLPQRAAITQTVIRWSPDSVWSVRDVASFRISHVESENLFINFVVSLHQQTTGVYEKTYEGLQRKGFMMTVT